MLKPKRRPPMGNAGKRIARSKALLLFNGRDCIQVGLAIFRCDVTLLIDKNLGIVNRCAIPLRYAANDCNRKLPGGFLKTRDKPVGPQSSMILHYPHRVAGINHFRKNNQLRASLLSSTRKVPNLEKICVRITEQTGDLSGSDLHVDSGTIR